MSATTNSVRVLHVDDDPDLATLTESFLTREDDRFEIETATTAAEGLNLLDRSEFSCIISDYDMPERNGIEFLERVREEHPDLPFILYTGKGSEEVASEAISAGATDYLQKEHGQSQYELLANRVLNAVEQYRTNRRAAKLDRIRTISTEINQALVRADSRPGVESRICEIISDSEPYLFAWIGEVDPETDRIEPRTAAGIDEEYLEEITVTADESPTGHGPAGTAIRERRVATSQNILEDPAFEPWREEAIDRGFQSVAAIPLEYEETLYGELVVYAERPYAFDDDEKGLLTELGNDISQAFYSLETRNDLREEREFIEQALDALNDVFYVVGPDGTMQQWNDHAEAVTGYRGEEVSNMQAIEFFPDGEQAKIVAAIEETLTTGSTTVESELLTADGERIPYELTGSRLTDLEGDLVGLIGIGRDISDRKERERRLETLIDNLPGMVYRCKNEPGWPMEYVRGDMADLTGYSPAEIENWNEIFGEKLIHPDDRESVWNDVQNALDGEESFDITYRLQTKAGDTIRVRERGQGIYSDDGDVVALEGFITEMTEYDESRETESGEYHFPGADEGCSNERSR